MKTFEKPLSNEEEKIYFTRYNNGDLEAGNVLIRKNMRLVAHMVKKYNYGERDTEDLISVGTIGLIKAVRTFDITKGRRFATYAAKCIDNELLMLLRAEKRKMREVSLYEPIETDKEGNEINLLDIIEAERYDVVEQLDLKENIEKLKNAIEEVLNDREKIIIKMRYGYMGCNEKTQKEISEILGISRSYVSRIEKQALKKLQEKIM